MAGESKGIAYEALLYAVVEDLISQNLVSGNLFWNEKPTRMTIDPDLTLGPNAEHPTHLLLVAHGGSAKESNRKFWRNVGELVEAKTLLPSQPEVYSVLFDAIVKPDVKTLEKASFDGSLIVGDRPYGGVIGDWIAANSGKLPVDKHGKVRAIRAAIQSAGGRQLAAACRELSSDVLQLFRSGGRNRRLWAQEASRVRPAPPATARQTSFRRGLGKLLVFDDLDLALRLYRREKVKLTEVPQYVFTTGLAKKSIGRASPSDSDILSAVSSLDDLTVRAVVGSAPAAKMSVWIAAVRNAAVVQARADYVLQKRQSLVRAQYLAQQLTALQANPRHITPVGAPPAWAPEHIWLFEIIVEIIKASTGKANGFGYSQLATEAARLPGMPTAKDRFYRIVLPDWVNRRGTEGIQSRHVAGVSSVLASQLGNIPVCELTKLVRDIGVSFAQNTMETKLISYRGFDPILHLILSACPSANIVYERTCFAQAAGLGGQAGKVRVARVGQTIVNWQSVTDAGRSHKKKELCAHAVGLRYVCEQRSQKFAPRPGTQRLLLVVDGTWTSEDLRSLVGAGWDSVFYPDEMDKLAAAIV